MAAYEILNLFQGRIYFQLQRIPRAFVEQKKPIFALDHRTVPEEELLKRGIEEHGLLIGFETANWSCPFIGIREYPF
jgi:hypothetical protein